MSVPQCLPPAPRQAVAAVAVACLGCSWSRRSWSSSRCRFSSGELLTLPDPRLFAALVRGFLHSSSKWLLATHNSFIVGIATAILATLLGTLAALGIFLGRFRGKALLVAMLATPMVVPVVVTAVAMYFALLARRPQQHADRAGARAYRAVACPTC